MATYFSTFITGFSDVIREVLPKRFRDVSIEEVLDGMIVYGTKASVDEIRTQKYFNNTFLLLGKVTAAPNDTTASLVKKLYKGADFAEVRRTGIVRGNATYRISISRENELTSINNEIVKKIEQKIQSQTPLKLDRQGADYEFWFVIRSEGSAYLGLRITKLKSKPEKGQLRPELAQLLCLLSNPAPEQTFMDPCAGSGAIVQERIALAPYHEIIAADTNADAVAQLKGTFRKNRGVRVLRTDVTHMSEIASHTVDAIVTDPPWGLFTDTEKDYVAFYTEMLKECARIMRPGGRIVILTARKEEFENAAEKVKAELIIQQKLDILVAGKKAAIYCLEPA